MSGRPAQTVPFLDLKAQNSSIGAELEAATKAVIVEAQFVLGPAVDRFESAFAKYLGVRYCVGLNNGTSALHLALLASGIGPGDEVITTPHTWISTSWAITYVGARPVYVDIDPQSYNLHPDLVESAITPRTRAILPVHLYGQACELTKLADIASRRNLLLIEDAAQAHGAVHEGRKTGSWGDAACFSFYPGKNLGAFGEAGAVVTEDASLAMRVRHLRDHAQSGRHNHVEIGYNCRMEGLQGAVLDVKLRHLDAWNAARRSHATLYTELLADVLGLKLPALPHSEGHVWHLFVVLLEDVDRQRMQQLLADRGIATAVHYPTLVPFQPAYSGLGHRAGDFPVAERVAARCLSLPMFPSLTDEQIQYVASSVQECLASARSA